MTVTSTLDFALLADGSVVVVELNPFDNFAGAVAGVFPWEDPDGARQLHGGTGACAGGITSGGGAVARRLHEAPPLPRGLQSMLAMVLTDIAWVDSRKPERKRCG